MSASYIKDDINNKLYARNLPSVLLQQSASFQLSQENARHEQKIDRCTMACNTFYKQEQVFHPGSSAPRYGYVSNIDQESILRKQIYPLQKGDLQYQSITLSQCNQSPLVKNNNAMFHPTQRLFMNSTRPH